MDRDRSWMYSRLNDGFITPNYFNGVEDFISFAFSQHDFVRGNKIRCPCVGCQNNKWQISDNVRKHLFLKGFCYGYTTWISHGEQPTGESSHSRADNEPICQGQNENLYARMVMDVAMGSFDFDANQGKELRVECESPNPSASNFFSLLQDADEPLWSGCVNYTKLSAVSQLLNCKAEFNMSESCFNRLIKVVKSMLPADECLLEDFYKMKKRLTKLGLGYVQIHVCPKNCILFYRETIELEICSICGHPRYKPSKSSGRRQKRIPFKILLYFPLVPRLQRLYMSAKIAEHMTWHAYNKSNDRVLRHPVDSEAWQHFNLTHESFAMEPQNVRLGLCADGFNPFGPASKPYSVWPVMLNVYNLPPWMCMKKPYIFLSMVIPGNPNQNIDVFFTAPNR
ncbi:uncharacterized protein LOC120280350 [Dioscorea cayenensis subsp. rotundata]|uniref:Uncharacterized protein LOC120280350 n=1 Tax=Dioscorea cayennensis subsp. rotundata TaxID=55577 RepID=A0AB40CV83_DIOCR|nr:uncharacterized protein LOC120280350 [Dioscorea cayenensis subsp. rotundata]XP_039143098.1 uncharacterized protein LOC120280350 [Dioscorea cayenensis subsp. rotundata]XP_039143099.1 uncharacterized protein LOC120280350 [Dioscorea cayenensis subsp. rotundata]XP_039143100.1 uncharacterized protein LOC120280350 [Dioscorea cayenensis subsp. rotundata]XP_039143101.1 uncharacterized protein LOC120280350 [Dioscorea cayenensis subsp. rotundata]XP_039143102.1 uncharacterized protein LOC120280350 [Di